jgi:C4-type Zn-finger protein
MFYVFLVVAAVLLLIVALVIVYFCSPKCPKCGERWTIDTNDVDEFPEDSKIGSTYREKRCRACGYFSRDYIGPVEMIPWL